LCERKQPIGQTAVNPRGHNVIRNAVAALLCGLVFLLSTGAAQAEKRIALIIGNSAYENAPTLPNPARDAQAVAAMFQKAGYDLVSTAYDLGYLELKRAIRRFEDAAADADIAVVYYAGHGIEIHGVNYLIPVDARLASDRDAIDETVTLDRLVETIDRAKRLRLIILDACRDNPFVHKIRQERVAALRGVTPGLAATEPASANTLIAYAAKAGSEAEDGTGVHSPFATALVNNLFVPGLDIRLAFGRVRDEVLVKTDSRQEPFVYGSLGGGNIALVPAASEHQPQAATDTDAEKSDYGRVEKIGTKHAWEIYLAQHPTGFYADLARENLAVLGRADSTRVADVQPTQGEKDRLAAEQAERDRLQRERAAQQAEQARLAAAQAEKDRRAKEQAENDRLAALQADQARLTAAQAEKDRLAKVQAEKDRLAAQQAEQARLAAAQAEKDRLAKEQAAKDRLAQQQAELALAAAAQAQKDWVAAEQAAGDMLARERAAKEQVEHDRLAQQQIESAKAAAPIAAKADPVGNAGNDTPGKLAMLTPPVEPASPKPAALSGGALVQAIKTELSRVGCYSGSIDDKWTSAETKSSLKKFVKYAKLSDASADPAIDLLNALRGKTGRICPLECSARETEKNGECVAKTCPSGSRLDSDGDCERSKAPEKSSPKPAATAELAPAPAPPAITPHGGKLDMPCRNAHWHRLAGGGCGY
jgi:hypothetical protein